MKKQQSKRVIPGFGLTMGVTLAMLSIVVLIPLASLAVYSARLGFREFIQVITRPRVLSGFYVSFITAFAATVVNAIMGLILAWVLVRYDFPGKRIMDVFLDPNSKLTVMSIPNIPPKKYMANNQEIICVSVNSPFDAPFIIISDGPVQPKIAASVPALTVLTFK